MDILRKPYLEADGNGGGADPEPTEPEVQEPMSFDDLLKANPDYQKELDRRLQKASDTAAANARAKEAEHQRALYDDKLSEQEKLAKMNEEEKSDYLRKKAEEALAEREAAVTKRELAAQAKEMFAEKGVDTTLADVVNYTDAASCKKSVDTITAAFNKAVENMVNEKLKGTAPLKDAATEGHANKKLADEDRVKDIMLRR